MRFDPPLEEARLLRRYKRFLADVVLADGRVITIHCPNTGSMRGCMPEGGRVWFSTSANPARKYAHTWELLETPGGHRIGIHTGRANALVAEALEAGAIPELAAWPRRRAEVRNGRSRVDFVLDHASRDDGPSCHLEVKSVTLGLESGLGVFPDARSERAQRHLRELTARAAAGLPAALLYCVQHTGIECVAPADDIDPEYGDTLRAALDAGVTVLAWQAALDAAGAVLRRPLPVLREAPEGAVMSA